MNPAAPLETEDKIGEGKIYDQIFAELEKIKRVSDIHRVGNHIYIGYSGKALPRVNSIVEGIFEKANRGDIFDWTLCDGNYEFRLSDINRQRLEARVRSKLAEFLEDPELGEVESIQVVWNVLTRVLRTIGINAQGMKGVLSVSGRESSQYHHVLSAIKERFEIPFTLRDVPPTKKD